MTGGIRRDTGKHKEDGSAAEEAPELGEGMESPGEVQEASGEECSRALHNIEKIANQMDNSPKGRWVETVENQNGIQVRLKAWVWNPSLPTETQMEQQGESRDCHEVGTVGGGTLGRLPEESVGGHPEQSNRRDSTGSIMQTQTGPSQGRAAYHVQREYGVKSLTWRGAKRQQAGRWKIPWRHTY